MWYIKVLGAERVLHQLFEHRFLTAGQIGDLMLHSEPFGIGGVLLYDSALSSWVKGAQTQGGIK